MLDIHDDTKIIEDVALISSRTIAGSSYIELVSCITELNVAGNVLDISLMVR
jgi:hypothetical protein